MLNSKFVILSSIFFLLTALHSPSYGIGKRTEESKKLSQARIAKAIETLERLSPAQTSKHRRLLQRSLSTLRQETANSTEKIIVLDALLTNSRLPIRDIMNAIFHSPRRHEDLLVIKKLYQLFESTSKYEDRLASARVLSLYPFQRKNIHNFLLEPFNDFSRNYEDHIKIEVAFYLLTSPFEIPHYISKVARITFELFEATPEKLNDWFSLRASTQSTLPKEKIKVLAKMYLKMMRSKKTFASQQDNIYNEATALSYLDEQAYDEAIKEFNAEQIGYCPLDQQIDPPPEIR